MKRLLMAITLACVVSGTALAGEMPTVIAPPAPDATVETVIPGEVTTGDSAAPGEMPTCGLSIVLTILDLVF